MPEENKPERVESVNKLWIFPLTRQFAAYVLMSLFVTCTTVGAFLIYLPAGFVTLGVASGVYAYLLGSD